MFINFGRISFMLYLNGFIMTVIVYETVVAFTMKLGGEFILLLVRNCVHVGKYLVLEL